MIPKRHGAPMSQAQPIIREDPSDEDADLLPLSRFKEPPKIIVIDVTNSCNLRCPVCPVTIAMTRRRGMMDMATFGMIINDFAENDDKPEIFFNFSGEPTLNPLLPELIGRAHDAGHGTFLSTNCTKLDRTMAEEIIKAGLGRVYLCMDGFDKEAQEAYRVRSDFDEVKRNIEIFVEARAALGADNPLCILQTLLTAYSENQADDITKWAKEIGIDRIRFKTFSVGTYTSEEEKRAAEKFLPKNPELRRNVAHTVSRLCDEPVDATLVFWDGSLGLCCIDYDQKVEMPNIRNGGFMAAYTSDAAATARRSGYLKTHEICRNCSYSNAENMGFKVDLRKA